MSELEQRLRNAVCLGNLEKVKELIWNVGVNEQFSLWNWTHWACFYEQEEILQYLVEEAAINLDATTGDGGFTALHVCCFYRPENVAMIEFLLASGINVQIKDDRGKVASDYVKDPKIKKMIEESIPKVEEVANEMLDDVLTEEEEEKVPEKEIVVPQKLSMEQPVEEIKKSLEDEMLDGIVTEIPKSEFLVVSDMGRGEIAIVTEGVWTGADNMKVCLKEMSFKDGYPKVAILREIASIIETAEKEKGEDFAVTTYGYSESGKNTMRVVMERVETNLEEYVKTTKLTLFQKFQIMKQMTDCLKFLHDNGMLHRRLKLSNFLRTKDGKIKITDYGYLIIPNYAVKVKKSFQFLSPEERKKKPEYFTETDIFHLGMAFFELIFKKKAKRNYETIDEIEYVFKKQYPRVPQQLKDLMLKCFKADYKERPSFKELYLWFKGKKVLFQNFYNYVV